ncbi:hypothetical protein N8I74_14205 [Chitiniphilus purpureus]|uniref:Rod shape-determining protein MreB n=1 Tax=Chitiniphilus purpureus TaxID=2981137 RepID=A0ABY6DJB6_9NEIS|nr:hypothetical protein [Chitiniphilus sp. CD1]UXY14460.1 hypothetical protein N8I74_14205 [Chitiniphilus sp. CD1]
MNFRETLYVTIARNTITVRCVDNRKQATATGSFSTSRLLVGNFSVAEALLRGLIPQVAARHFYKTLVAVVHPLELVEGGLSQIEERVFNELGLGCGARKIHLHVGSMLDDQAVLAMLGA